MAFSEHQIDDLKQRADLVSLIGQRVPLRRTGHTFMGLCPFHGEKSASFSVVPNHHYWNCFGCGEKGNVFQFFMKLDGLSFVDAVQFVAQQMGVVLVDESVDPEEARRRAHLDALAELVERAVKFYEHKLWQPSGAGARRHLVERGVAEEWVRRFRLGFGGLASDELSRALEKAGIPADLAVETGLVLRSQNGGGLYDRFKGRLIVPIRVPRPPHGRSVGLGGRFLPGVTPVPRDPAYKPAKYINSPETPLYHKGSVLFGLDLARDAIRKAERALVVEGYFDVIGLHQAGVPLAVASCGTALTPGHLDLLLRTGAKEIVFLFDGDAAGLRAAAKAAEMCAKSQVPAKVATLPDGLDPDEFARKRGPEGLQALLERAKPAIEMLIDTALAELGPQATVEERVRAVQHVRPVVLAAPEGLSRELYIGQIAERLRVTPDAVRSVVAEAPPPGPQHRGPFRDGPPREGDPREGAPVEGPGPDGAAQEGYRDRPQRGAYRDRPYGDRPYRDRKWGEREQAPADDLRDADPDMPPLPPPPQPERKFRKDGEGKFGGKKWGERKWGEREPQWAPRLGDSPADYAKRTYPIEESITLALLKYPVLAGVVAQEGVLAEFGHPVLRQLAESVLQAAQEQQHVEAGGLLAQVADPALRATLERRLAEDDANLEDSAAHLGRVLDKMREQILRVRARARAQQVQAAGEGDVARQLLEEAQRRLEERRALELRRAERERKKF